MYSLQIRKKMMLVKEEEKLSIRGIAKRYGISPNTIYRWLKKLEPKKERKERATKIDMKGLEADVKKHPDLYQYERGEKFKVRQSTICYALKRLGISYKKNLQTSKSGREKA